MHSVGRRAFAGGVVLAAIAGGALIAQAQGAPSHKAAAKGGLGIAPAVEERAAGAGALTPLTVYNHSDKPLDITIAVRPWVQSTSGVVKVNRAKTLSGVTVSDTKFTLAAGATKAVSVTATTGASTFGGIEVIGIPSDAPTKGVIAGYRLISSVRLDPASRVYDVKAGKAKLVGKGSKRALVLPVKNAGNTVEPISGSVSLKGPLGTRRSELGSVRILPGKTVNALLSSAKKLSSGSYTATVTLKQGGKTFSVTKKLKVSKH
jgi:hypothetical protein